LLTFPFIVKCPSHETTQQENERGSIQNGKSKWEEFSLGCPFIVFWGVVSKMPLQVCVGVNWQVSFQFKFKKSRGSISRQFTISESFSSKISINILRILEYSKVNSIEEHSTGMVDLFGIPIAFLVALKSTMLEKFDHWKFW
jgi:hypothetical protein